MSEFGSVTRCPWCESSFHVGLMQLEAAGGRVRCGGCLKVFDARQHFIVEQKSIFDLDHAEAIDSNHPLAADTLAESQPLPQREISHPPVPPTIQPRNDAKLAAFVDAVDSFSATTSNTNVMHPTAANEAAENPDDWEPLLIPARDEDDEKPTKAQADPDQQLENLFLQSAKRKAAKAPSLVWSVVAIGLALALLGQALWWQPAGLANLLPFQQLSANLCPLIHCPVEPVRELEQISVTGLVLPSQDYRQSLLVQAELRNQASRDQYFPAIQLDFLDLAGSVVASRRFQPREYLRSDAAGRTYLKAGQPIQVQLQIYDPGAAAISYRFAAVHAN